MTKLAVTCTTYWISYKSKKVFVVTDGLLQYISWRRRRRRRSRRRRRRQCWCVLIRGGGNDLFTHQGINRRGSWLGYQRGCKWDDDVLNLKVLSEIIKQQLALLDNVMEWDPGNPWSPTVDRLRLHIDFKLKLNRNCKQTMFRLSSLNPLFYSGSANPLQSTEDLFWLTRFKKCYYMSIACIISFTANNYQLTYFLLPFQ
jgi:hypothetical protein